ncbi:MAG: ribose-phosphate diphosphokinase, partial [Gemmatimonadales bacterium]
IIDKRRPAANVAEVLNVVGEVEGRDCLIVDDMVDTAGTLSGAVGALKDLGVNKVYCCASHPLLSGPAVERLSAAPLTEMAVVNTIHVPQERRFETLKVLSVAPLLAKAIRYIHSGESVSSLFEAL